MRLIIAIVFLIFAACAPVAASDAMLCVQQYLTALGHDAGTPDGAIGPKTRQAAALYLSSNQAPLPELSEGTASEWCGYLKGKHPDALKQATLTPDDVLIPGPDVSDDVEARLSNALMVSHALLLEKFGVTLTRPVQVFASNDARWLADNYLRAKGLSEGYRNGKIEEFGSCQPAAEGGYYVMFLCLGDQRWQYVEDSVGTIMHEYTHNLQYELLGEKGRTCCTDNNAMSVFGPQWLMEGSAEYLNFVMRDSLGAISLADEIATMRKKVSFFDKTLRSRETRKGYREMPRSWDIGVLATHELVQRSGYPSLIAYWRTVAQSDDYDGAFKTAFGMTPDEFEAEFLKLWE